MAEQATVFARWTSGFRAPTLTELHYRGITPRGALEGNNELEPEESVSTELGFELRRDHFSLSLTGYRTDIDRYIERFDKTVTTRSYRNIGKGVIRGYEFRVALKPSQSWAHEISYGYQSGRSLRPAVGWLILTQVNGGMALRGARHGQLSWISLTERVGQNLDRGRHL